MATNRDGSSPNRLFMTNDYSILSKYSAAKLGYFHDSPLIELVDKRFKLKRGKRRSALVNIAYANRVLVVDYHVTNHIRSGQVECVIVLGCGFDTLPTRHISIGCHWIEIDLPQVIKTKASFLAAEWGVPAIQVDGDPHVISFGDRPIHLISCDIRFQDELSSKLERVISCLAIKKDVAIVNEVCLNYMETNEVKQVLSTISECIKKKASKLRYIGFEQVLPGKNDPFTQVMIDHFKAIGHPLKHVLTRSELATLFIDQLEFELLDIESIHELYRKQNQLQSRELCFQFNREPFDEFEELDMYMAHYAVVTAEKCLGKRNSNSRASVRRLRGLSMSMDDSFAEIKSNLVRFEANEHIMRYAHSVCILRDTLEEQSVLITGGFGVAGEGKQHKRLGECMILTRDRSKSHVWQARPISLRRFREFEAGIFSMHGQTCCLGSRGHFSVLFFCGRTCPTVPKKPRPIFVARISPDYDLEHVFTNPLDPSSTESPWFIRPPCTIWRHQIVKRSSDVIQLGGLTARGDSLGLEGMPIIRYELIGNLSFTMNSIRSVAPRHSFGADKRDEQTLLIHGGLEVGRGFESGNSNSVETSNKHCDSDIRASHETILYDFRVGDPSLRTQESRSSAYGMQVHFVNDQQFVRVGGISIATGLAQQSIDLFDLRRIGGGPVVRTPVDSRHNDLLLCNAQSVKFKSSKEIVTFGGGGTCFTFGTHFNQSQVVYDYSQFQSAFY